MARWALIAALGLGSAACGVAELQRILRADGVELRLRFSHAYLSTLRTGRVCGILAEPTATFVPDSQSAAVECLNFFLALPCLECRPELTYVPAESSRWEPVELATVGEAFGGNSQRLSEAFGPRAELQPLGRWRGVPLALLRVCPWGYEPERKQLQLWRELQIRIRYPAPVPVHTQAHAWAPGEGVWAGLLLNAEHARAFRQPPAMAVEAEPPFAPQQPFVRLTTRRDGIAMVRLNRVLELMPEWRGVASERLELLWRGHPVPILLRDGNGVLDDTDTLFFFGRRAAGDTTWWDAYAAEESFFLVLRDSGSGRRFAPFAAEAADSESVAVLPTLVHREDERTYVSGVYDGFYRSWTETAPGEGWYWATLQAGQSAWDDSLQLPAAGAVWMSIRGYALNSLPSCAPEHRLVLLLNGDTLDRVEARGWGPLQWERTLPVGSWSAGWNRLQIRSLAADTGMLCTAAQQALDFLEFRIQPQPVAIGGAWYGGVATAERAGWLRLHGFRSATVVALDTLRGRAAVLTGEPEHLVRVTARGGSRPSVEIFLGDSLVLRSEQQGTACLWWEPDQQRWQQRWFLAGAGELLQFLQQLPRGSELVGASVAELSRDVRELLRRWGLDREPAASAGAWVWAVRIGDTASAREQKAAPGNWAYLLWSHAGGYGQYTVAVPLAARDTAFLWVTDSRQWEEVRLERREPPTLLAPEPQADVICIASPALYGSAQRWAQYRRRTHGVSTRVVATDDIAVSFGFGRLTPHAIKAFLRYAYTHWQPPAPQFLLLWGTANWDARNLLGFPKANAVPSYGVPPSDYWYTLLDGEDYLPELFVGRIPAADSAEAEAVLNKIQAWDSSAELWRKRALLLFGYGFTDTMDIYYTWLTQRLGMEPTVIQKETPEPSSSRYGPQIRQLLEHGTGVTMYFGHGAEANMEVQGWEPTRLNNTDRQGLLLTFSCSMGNFAVPYTRAFNEQYVVLPRRGMVAALGMSGIGWDIVERTVKHYFVQTLVEQPLRLLGPLYQEARLPLLPFVGQEIYRETVLQHTLLGDPLLRFPVDTVPEFVVLPGTPFLHRGDGVPAEEFTAGDSIFVRVAVGNLGVVPQRAWKLRLVHGGDTLWLPAGAVRWSWSVDVVLPAKWCEVGEHQLWLELNPDSLVPERTWQNNRAQLTYRVRQRQLVPLEPLPFWHLRSGHKRFRVLNPIGPAEAFRYEVELWHGERLLERGTEAVLSRFDEVVDWEPKTALEPGTGYRFRIRAAVPGDTLWTQWLEVPFWVDTVADLYWVSWQQSGGELAAASLWNMEPTEAGLRLRQWRRQLEVVSDPVRSRAFIYLDGKPVLELEQEAGIGALVLVPGDTTARVRFYRTGRTGQSEDAGYFLALVRDSLRAGQYLVWTLSGEGLWRFSEAQLDTLRRLLRELYGSRLADSLERSVVAFAFVGRRDSRVGSAIEGFRRRDSLRVAAEIVRPMEQGRVLTSWIGPARQLGKLRLRLSQPQQWTLAVYGRRSLEETGSDLLWLGRGDTLVDLSAERYAYVQLELEAVAPDSGAALPELSQIALGFEPQGDVALGAQSLQAPPVLLGDTLPIRLRMWNRALRARASALRLQLGTRSSDGISSERASVSLPAYELPADTSAELQLGVPTVGWEPRGILWATASAAGELYRFNNGTEVPYQLGLDTLPPNLQLWWQEAESVLRLDSGMAISRQPQLWLVLYDNGAPLPLTVSSPLQLWIEGVRMDSMTAEEYRLCVGAELDSVPSPLRLPMLRAALRLRPSRLPLGNVLVWAVGQDAAGLRDTLTLLLTVTDRLAVRLLRYYPVPARLGDAVEVQFVYDGYRLQGHARGEVFSVLGERLFSKEIPLTVGQNRWSWDGRRDTGERVGPGVYLWRIWIPEMGSEQGISGAFVLVP